VYPAIFHISEHRQNHSKNINVFHLHAAINLTNTQFKRTIMDTDDKESWSQIRETILMINVAVARIEHAMIEGDDSFTSLSKSFVETVNAATTITATANHLEESELKDTIKENCQDITLRVTDSIISFQFYDKLSQRMALVSKTLSCLTEILKDKNKTGNIEEWKNLQNLIRSKYTLDADQDLFDTVISGTPIQEALKIAVNKTTEDDVEFF